jgi:hypothetical protein
MVVRDDRVAERERKVGGVAKRCWLGSVEEWDVA